LGQALFSDNPFDFLPNQSKRRPRADAQRRSPAPPVTSAGALLSGSTENRRADRSIHHEHHDQHHDAASKSTAAALQKAKPQRRMARAVLFHRARQADPLRCWAQKLMETKPFELVAVAAANKLARIVFAVMTTGTSYRAAKA
jgi:hypothetical protein